MFTVHEEDFCDAVATLLIRARMVDETSLVTLPCGVDRPITIEVEEKGGILALVYDRTAFGLIKRDDLFKVRISFSCLSVF